jgi:acetyltransferase-like isoleucine patch superfamily enzyme
MAKKTSYRPVEISDEGLRVFGELLAELKRALADPATDRRVLCRDFLVSIFRGVDADYDTLLHNAKLSPAARAHVANFDPANATLEAEYYKEVDAEKFGRVKPLLWMWYMFDRSPLAYNVGLGVEFRRVLAPHIFRKCGENVKFFQDVMFSFGYNISVGSNTVVHRNVLLDDRGEIVLGDNVSLSDYANVYSHGHGVLDIHDVSLGRTVIGDGARITYHATVFSGVEVGADAMVGSHGVATRNVPPGHVVGGVPAKLLTVKKR